MLGWEVLSSTVMTQSFVSCDKYETSRSLQPDLQALGAFWDQDSQQYF